MIDSLTQKLKDTRFVVDDVSEASGPSGLATSEDCFVVQPTPGCVVKFKKARLLFSHEEEQKCFINVGHCIEIAAPTFGEGEAELAAMMRVDDSSIDVPFSLGGLETIRDNNGMRCLKFDCIINSDFYRTSFQHSEFHRQVSLVAFLNRIEAVHSVRVTRSSQVLLRNKKVIGTMHAHRIPKSSQPKPRIVDLTSPDLSAPGQQHQHENVSVCIETTPNASSVLRAKVIISEDVDAAGIRLEANPDHVVVFIRGVRRVADFFVPVDLIVESIAAKLLKTEKGSVLEITADYVLPGQ